MLAIVLKDSTYNRVVTRSRHHSPLSPFTTLPCRVSHDHGFTYMYYQSLADMCYATDYLYSYDAVFRVADLSI